MDSPVRSRSELNCRSAGTSLSCRPTLSISIRFAPGGESAAPAPAGSGDADLGDFADLAAEIQQRTAIRLREALADRLARLTLAGQLRRSDPDVAAEQYLALLTGPLETRSRPGTRKISAAELRAIAEAATDTFLRAYAPE
ncbi:TetR/AcrR family transcriptional regulator C-terminal domain-containing protein [Nocardia sp. CC227C]|uniref:TetR/AcrR family transcriptional regulator C-terminal domain-containing protein n=1 Tax=Nocardia sp. CC227C TaxID=3044562 RepID=UPI00278BD377|nr:TetR/AcrR family transcriptional regulator C-terminal domain-containing protein [Nocardia sp. CC227C]